MKVTIKYALVEISYSCNQDFCKTFALAWTSVWLWSSEDLEAHKSNWAWWNCMGKIFFINLIPFFVGQGENTIYVALVSYGGKFQLVSRPLEF